MKHTSLLISKNRNWISLKYIVCLEIKNTCTCMYLKYKKNRLGIGHSGTIVNNHYIETIITYIKHNNCYEQSRKANLWHPNLNSFAHCTKQQRVCKLTFKLKFGRLSFRWWSSYLCCWRVSVGHVM